jgi:hypothetical protein
MDVDDLVASPGVLAGAASSAGDEGDNFSGAAGDDYDVASGYADSGSDAGSVSEGGTERAPTSSRSSSSPAPNAPGHLPAAQVSSGSEGGGEGSERGGEGSGCGDEVGGGGEGEGGGGGDVARGEGDGGGVELGGGDRDSGLSADPPKRTPSILPRPGLPRRPPPRPCGLQPPRPPLPRRPSLLNDQGLARSRSSARVSMPPIQHGSERRAPARLPRRGCRSRTRSSERPCRSTRAP